VVSQVSQADWASPAELKEAIRSASILKDGRAVFNIAGNKYRIVVWINYPTGSFTSVSSGTHRQYDRIDAQTSERRQPWISAPIKTRATIGKP